jgi:predicted ferric reductase
MTYTVRSFAWIVVYLLFVLLPLFALLTGSLPPARGFWTEFSAALGYSGLAIMGLQFGITARFRYVTEPWGEDVIYHFHRQISLCAVALVVVHPLIMLAVHPELFTLPQYGEVPLGAVFAFLSLFSLLAMVVTALWRAKLKIPRTNRQAAIHAPPPLPRGGSAP